MPTTRSSIRPCRQSSTVAFYNIVELRHLMLNCLPLVSLMTYARTSLESKAEVHKVLRRRIIRYVAPFLRDALDVSIFFSRLGTSRSWIVGSVALAAVSCGRDVRVPDNLNIIAAHGTAQAWIGFWRDELGFTMLMAKPCTGFYAQQGRYYLTFSHADLPGKIVTVTTARSDPFCELFLRCRTTLTTNAISASELISVYVDLTSNFEGIWGHRSTAAQLNDDDCVSPFPDDITLHESSNQLGRPCGLACPARPRWSTNIAGIGHWSWGGFDGAGAGGPDPTLESMRLTDVKYRTGLDIDKSIHCPSIGVAGIIEFVSAKSVGFTMLSISTSNHAGCTNFLHTLKLRMFASLERLVITGVANFAYSWNRSAHFTELTTLALCDLSTDVAPSTIELYRLLSTAVELERLCIDNVESAGSVDGLERRKFDLGGLMALLRAPRLQHVSVVVLAEDDLDILMDYKIQGFYDTTRNIIELDASSAVREFCTAIDPDSEFWCGIERAYFRDVRMEDITRLVETSARPTRLKFLGVYFTRYNLWPAEDDQRVSAHVDKVDLCLRTRN
ncbi:hypothetical protein K438DRAFT_2001153 [Mycena galopus ATCC 62051]|nr:hypothetical protein K438DRAFT_2001153 [Mycena galopus ATCC 62051]